MRLALNLHVQAVKIICAPCACLDILYIQQDNALNVPVIVFNALKVEYVFFVMVCILLIKEFVHPIIIQDV